MRLGISSPLKHDTPEECGPGDGEFPLKYYVEKMSEIDPEMPMILEHLNTDEEYIRYLGYIKKEIV